MIGRIKAKHPPRQGAGGVCISVVKWKGGDWPQMGWEMGCNRLFNASCAGHEQQDGRGTAGVWGLSIKAPRSDQPRRQVRVCVWK